MKNRQLLCLLLALLCLSGCGASAASPSAPPPAPGELEIYVFDAGKADAILLSGEGHAVLIDCGEKGFGSTILAALDARGITRLDALILTHFDKDHVGGAAKILGSIPVGVVYQTCGAPDSVEYQRYLRALGRAGLRPQTLREPVGFPLGGADYRIEPPLREHYDKDEDNNLSLIVTVTHGANTLLFLGDAESERIAEYLAASPVDCGLLKVPHHGGREKLLSALLGQVRPELAVITCSEKEPESAATLSALRAAGAEVFLTRCGAVRIVSDGERLLADYDEQKNKP